MSISQVDVGQNRREKYFLSGILESFKNKIYQIGSISDHSGKVWLGSLGFSNFWSFIVTGLKGAIKFRCKECFFNDEYFIRSMVVDIGFHGLTFPFVFVINGLLFVDVVEASVLDSASGRGGDAAFMDRHGVAGSVFFLHVVMQSAFGLIKSNRHLFGGLCTLLIYREICPFAMYSSRRNFIHNPALESTGGCCRK